MEVRLSPCREDNAIETSQCTSLIQPVGRGDNYGQVSPLWTGFSSQSFKLYRQNNIRIMCNKVCTPLLSLNSMLATTGHIHHIIPSSNNYCKFIPILASSSTTSSQLNSAETSQAFLPWALWSLYCAPLLH